MNAGTGVAAQAASLGGYGREAGLARSLYSFMNAISAQSEAEQAAQIDQRILDLELLGERKGCF